jgi:hypothetical protein
MTSLVTVLGHSPDVRKVVSEGPSTIALFTDGSVKPPQES